MKSELIRLSIELTNLCQLSCLCCIHHGPWYKGQADSHPKNMNFDFFKDIVDQFMRMPGDSKHISLQFQGEPLMYPQIKEAYNYIQKKGAIFNITTNGMLMDKEMTNFLLGLSGLQQVSFSVDGYTAETNEKIRVGVNHQKLLGNIHYFIKEASENRPDLYIGVNMVLMEENKHEYGDFIYYWTLIREIHTLVTIVTDEEGIPTKKYWDPPEKLICKSPFTFLVVLTNGEVIPCCRDHSYEMIMGNLHTHFLGEIWRGLKYKILRNIQESQIWNEVKPYLCYNCDTWMGDYTETLIKREFFDENILIKQGPYWEEAILLQENR